MKDSDNQSSSPAATSRRNFVKTSAVAGAVLSANTTVARAQASTAANSLINVALIGCGAQGEKQVESVIGRSPVAGLNFVAVCDIQKTSRDSKAKLIAKYQAKNKGGNVTVRDEYGKIAQYEDHMEMLETEGDNIDAVLIASPDFMHHVQTRASLEAGKAVYCEKMMSNTLEGCRDMVRAQRETDGILQIGHQRRSNPRYSALRDGLVFGEEAFGRITHAYGQWNRSTTSGKVSVPKKKKLWLSEELLNKYGFGDSNLTHEQLMYRFKNWRFFRKFGGGVVSDLGAHQIDIFNWMFGTTPTSVMAAGGVDYFPDSELYDNVMSIYEYDTPKGISRGYYQVLTTTSALGFFERFMGDKGTVSISEIPTTNQAYPEAGADWDGLVAKGLLKRNDPEVKFNPWDIPKTWGSKPKPWLASTKAGQADSRATKALGAWELSTELDEMPHTPHLRNFFDVVRSGKKEDLNCNVQTAFETAVTILKIYESAESGQKAMFSPEDFVA